MPEKKLCSKCGVNEPKPGQRWCPDCKNGNAAENRKSMPAKEKLSVLIPDPKNANQGTDRGRKVLRTSLADHGAGRSILIDKNNVIIAGNKTVEQAHGAGIKNVRIIDTDGNELIAVRRTDLDLETDSVAQKLAIADNRVAELDLSWDPAVLQQLAGAVDLSGMFTQKELGALFAGLQTGKANDEVPDMPSEPVTQVGDLWQLGPHRVYCGDGTTAEALTIALDGKPAHLAWTDPPYNVSYVGKTAEALTIDNDTISPEEFAAFLGRAMTTLSSNLRPGGAFYVSQADRAFALLWQATLAAQLMPKQMLIWAKDAIVLGYQDFHWQHEPILYGFKKARELEEDMASDPAWVHDPILYGWKPGASHNWYSDRRRSTILSYARPKRSAVHPTMKPVALVEDCIRYSTKPGDLVADNFGGSGTTLMAAHANERLAGLVELDPGYCDVIVQRWEEFTGGKATRIQTT